ncbi:MAG TPA: two-component regulator propeller domain-containing protein, partial [Draconibacterium sp.]|nr:two-component regulator propeller domain-containing protein [Draconibacterium sp.]
MPYNEFSINAVFSIYDDNNGILWLGTRAGIIRFDPSSEKFAVYPSLDYGLVQVITQDPTGQFWVGSQKGLFQFNSQDSQKVNPVPLDTELNKTTPAVLALFTDHDGVLWIGTEGAGIFYINTKNTPLIATHFPTNKNYFGRINSIVEDSVNNLWFATGNGLA